MISVCMTTYNGEKYIMEQIDSILSQTMPVDEIIICDDGSNDHTVSLIQSISDDRIHLIQNKKNLGYKKNFIQSISLSHGDYILLSDQDDAWYKNKVETLYKMMETNKNIEVLASSFRYMDANSKEFEVELIPGFSNNNLYQREVEEGKLVEAELEEFIGHNWFQGCSLIIRKDMKEEIVSIYDDILPHDWFINMMAASKSGMYFYNIPLFKYRIHEGNTIGVLGMYKGLKKVKSAISFYRRTLVFEDFVKTIKALEIINPEYYEKNREELEKLKEFNQNYFDAMKNKKFFTVYSLSKSEYYRRIKSKQARMMDLLYCLIGKKGE